MKKIKMIISCLLAVVLISLSAFPAFAADSEMRQQLDREVRIVHDKYYSLLGGVEFYSSDSRTRLNMAYTNAFNVLDNESSTDDDYLLAYNMLIYAEERMYVDTKWAQEEYDLCIAETNEDNWYSEDVWNNYMTELSAFKSALDSGREDIIDEYYFKIQSLYNEMCNSYTLVGDLDKSGVVTVKDVAIIQIYLAGLKTLTGGQLRVSSINCNLYQLSILCATDLQLYIAGLADEPKTYTYFYGQNPIINPSHDLFGNASSIKRNRSEQ